MQICCYILTSQRFLITTELWFFWFSSTPLHSPPVGSVRGKKWIYLYCCTCKKSSELENTTVFPLAWVTLFQKRARDKGTFVCVKCGRLQSCFPDRHLHWDELRLSTNLISPCLGRYQEPPNRITRTLICLLCWLLTMWHCCMARGINEAAVPGTAHALAFLSHNVAFTCLR